VFPDIGSRRQGPGPALNKWPHYFAHISEFTVFFVGGSNRKCASTCEKCNFTHAEINCCSVHCCLSSAYYCCLLCRIYLFKCRSGNSRKLAQAPVALAMAVTACMGSFMSSQ